MPPFRSARRALAILLLVSSGACSFDEAELIRPGTAAISAEVDQLRVLSYSVDPTAGDDWIDVLGPDPTVVDEAAEYLEDDGARLAEADEPADRRRLFTAVGAGRTLLVEINCRDCRDGVPGTTPPDTGIHVWDFAVDPATSDLSAGTDVASPDLVTTRAVGEYVVVVRDANDGATPLGEVPSADGEEFPLELVAFHAPDAGADVWVHVYLAARAGAGDLVDPGRGVRYPVRVTR